MAEKKTIKIKNGEIELIKFGKGERTLVILPGLSYDGFFPQAETVENAYGIFAERFTVYLIDRNKYPHSGYLVRDIAEDTVETLKKLRIENADFLGVSLGGMVAQEIAVNYPQLVNKLVLGSTLSRPNINFLRVLSHWEDLALRGNIDDMTAAFNETIYSPATLKKYALIFSKTKTVASSDKTARFLTYVSAAKNFNVYDLLYKITSKTLVIGSKGDTVTTAAAARETAKAINSGYYEYKNFGHAVFDEAPDYKKRVFDFLTE